MQLNFIRFFYDTTLNLGSGGDVIITEDITTLEGGAVSGKKAERVKIGFGNSAVFQSVNAANGLPVVGANIAGTSGNVAAAGTGTIGGLDVSKAGNVTFILKNQTAGSAWAGAPVLVFEQSDDNVSWAPLTVVRCDTSEAKSTHIMGVGAANASIMFDAASEGVNYVRVRVTTGPATNGITVVIQPGGMPFSPFVTTLRRSDANRTSLILSNTAQATGTTGVEAMVTLLISAGPGAASSGTTYNIPAGKTLRITGISFAQVGNATATQASTTFRLRLNTAGAVIVSSTPILLQCRVVTPATTLAFSRFDVPVNDGYEIVGGANVNIGVTVNSVFVTNAPLVDVTIVGYLY